MGPFPLSLSLCSLLARAPPDLHRGPGTLTRIVPCSFVRSSGGPPPPPPAARLFLTAPFGSCWSSWSGWWSCWLMGQARQPASPPLCGYFYKSWAEGRGRPKVAPNEAPSQHHGRVSSPFSTSNRATLLVGDDMGYREPLLLGVACPFSMRRAALSGVGLAGAYLHLAWRYELVSRCDGRRPVLDRLGGLASFRGWRRGAAEAVHASHSQVRKFTSCTVSSLSPTVGRGIPLGASCPRICLLSLTFCPCLCLSGPPGVRLSGCAP